MLFAMTKALEKQIGGLQELRKHLVSPTYSY